MTDLLYTHTQRCFGRDLYTDMPHCDLQMVGFALYKETFICVEKLGEKYKNPTLTQDPLLPVVIMINSLTIWAIKEKPIHFILYQILDSTREYQPSIQQ